ncbi:MAG: hypothetical protein JEZ02_08400 [Desulfatibacillum sp.]|nr:hypothetical protein [Desulfatibacillum sp.]
MSHFNDKHSPSMHPGWLIPLTVLCGTMATGPLAGSMLAGHGRKILAWCTGVLGFAAGIATLWTMVTWNTEWSRVGLVLTGLNLVFGLGLWRLVIELSPAPGNGEIPSGMEGGPERGGFRQILTGLIGGAMVTGIVGAVCAIFYLLLADALFSTWFPVTFEDNYAMARLAFSGFCLTAAGALAGAIGGRLRPGIRPWPFVVGCLAIVYAYLSWEMAAEITIALPGFQAGAVTGSGWEDILNSMVLGGFCIGILWAVFWAFHIMAPVPNYVKARRAIAVLGFNLAAAATLAITFGYAAETYLAAGLHMERRAYISNALWCYEHGLKKMPKENIASFLQYRAALIYHKLGREDLAEKGFERLVTKYNANSTLAEKSGKFLDSLRRSSGLARVVLPGVETRTEYKSSYCVPNSLALTMRYWGADVDAREIGRKITGLSGGTFSVNQAWFAIQKGFRHDFLPMAGLSDIKRCIDAGFPVMVYVPSHVLVIFGYDEALETFVTYDTATSDLWSEYIQQDFIKAWKRRATTVVLAYPPDKESQLPPDIAQRLRDFSNKYLHYQLCALDSAGNEVSVPHLMAAAGDTGEFFFPVTAMYASFPGLRQDLTERFDPEIVIKSIRGYFGEDFDEGEHLYGQYHDEESVDDDMALRDSIYYLIGNRRFDMVENLITRIDEEGPLSSNILGDAGIIDLVWGDYDRGLDRIQRAIDDYSEMDWAFYLGLARKKGGNTREAVRLLVQAVDYGSRGSQRGRRDSMPLHDSSLDVRIGLDEYGFPALALANGILAETEDLGESREELMPVWERWHHFLPFDASVAAALSALYEEDLARLNPKKDASEIYKTTNKLKLVRRRATNYRPETFFPDFQAPRTNFFGGES